MSPTFIRRILRLKIIGSSSGSSPRSSASPLSFTTMSPALSPAFSAGEFFRMSPSSMAGWSFRPTDSATSLFSPAIACCGTPSHGSFIGSPALGGILQALREVVRRDEEERGAQQRDERGAEIAVEERRVLRLRVDEADRLAVGVEDRRGDAGESAADHQHLRDLAAQVRRDRAARQVRLVPAVLRQQPDRRDLVAGG